MLIPRFTLDQDQNSLIINVVAKHCKLRELEVDAHDNCFLFSCWPYFLRLNLPGNIEDENMKVSYDTDTGEFTFSYTKKIQGEIFEDLDFISKFLVKKTDASYDVENDRQKITVLSGEGEITKEENEGCSSSHFLTNGFGFALLGSTHFKAVYAEYFDVLEVDPFKVDLKDRRKLRIKNEDLKFNGDYYLCDLLESEEIEQVMKQVTPWEIFDSCTLNFTNKELDFLKELPDKVYKLDSVLVNFVYNTLIDILYAYCYNQRVNFYEENSESGWNIVTLSASLSWLDVFETPKETMTFAFRRSLIYPLYRHFDLSVKVFEDLKKLLDLGEKFIVKCLIEIYYIFLEGDCCRYILNNLFIKDYINYIMRWDKNKWREYLKSVHSVDIQKIDLGLNLLMLEEHALEESIAKLNINDEGSDNTDESSEDKCESNCVCISNEDTVNIIKVAPNKIINQLKVPHE